MNRCCHAVAGVCRLLVRLLGRVGKLRWLSAVHALILLVATYLVWNLPYDFTGEGVSFLQYWHLAKSHVTEDDAVPEELYLVNTCYDHTMVPVRDALDIECGTIDITDREKLLTLMRALKQENDYRYIVCDISLNKQYVTPADSALFSLMQTMDRCMVADLDNVELPLQLKALGARSEYGISISNNNFLKYQYMQDGTPSMALQMATEMDDVSFTQKGLFYFLDGKLCNNAHIVDFRTCIRNEYNSNLVKNILQLGTDVLPQIDAGCRGMFKDKIVMIGDFFENDIHSTIAGELSGCVITYNAYLALKAHENEVPFLLMAFLCIAYFYLTLLILRGNDDAYKSSAKWLKWAVQISVPVLFIAFGAYMQTLLFLIYYQFFRWAVALGRKFITR